MKGGLLLRPNWREPGLFWFLILSFFLHLVFFLWPKVKETPSFSSSSLTLELGETGGGAPLPAPKIPEIPKMASPKSIPVEVKNLPFPSTIKTFPGEESFRVAEVRLPTRGAFSARDFAAPPVPGLPDLRSGKASGTGQALADYFARVRHLIEAKKCYPLRARLAGYEGEVTVSFVIEADGGVRKIEIVKPSPFPVLNQAAKRTIEQAAPFPPPPRKLHPPLELSVKLTYRLDG